MELAAPNPHTAQLVKYCSLAHYCTAKTKIMKSQASHVCTVRVPYQTMAHQFGQYAQSGTCTEYSAVGIAHSINTPTC